MKAIRGKYRPCGHLSRPDGRRIWLVRSLLFLLLLFLGLSKFSLSLAETNSGFSKGTQKILDAPPVPKEFGEVIYQSNGESSKQLFIVGLEHRDSITRFNGAHTSKVQAEVYKIGEWLVLNEELGLLLPEGFFTKKTGKAVLTRSPAESRPNGPRLLDSKDLERKLADNSTYVNAEMLLKKYYGLRTRQVEDKRLYDAVHDSLCKLAMNGNNSCDFLSLKSELDYRQEKRLAAMLQKIPEIIDEEFQQSNIQNKRALFTIGISHVSNIIKYLNNKKIRLYSPLLAPDKNGDCVDDLNLLKGRFGVTVIVPRKLADDDEILRIVRLDNIIEQYRKPTSSLPPQISP